MESLELRCMLCGQLCEIGKEHQDYKKLSENRTTSVFICDFCNNRVRFESDEQRKPKKPMNS